MNRVLILGAGTAGTMMANKLVGALDASRGWQVTVVDRDDVHLYQPGLLLLPFGEYTPEELVRSRRRTLAPEVDLRLVGVDAIEPDRRRVRLGDGTWLDYTLLIVASGSRTVAEQTEGLTGEGWRDTAHEFYSLEGAVALRDSLATFQGGRVVVNFADLPIKCPVAPLEMTFLMEAFLTQRGLREASQIIYATPLDAAFTKPVASQVLGGLMAERGVQVESDFLLDGVDGQRRVMSSADGRELEYDLLVTVPLHQGAQVITSSGLGDDLGFLPTDRHTLKARDHERIFALGDATDLPASKAGSVAHFQAEVLIQNVLSEVAGRGPVAHFDGHANCFIETGHDRAMLIDFNYETEPLPGKYPLPGLGPFTLLGESRANHWGKLGFKWAYWNLLLEGKELPIGHAMSPLGKTRRAA